MYDHRTMAGWDIDPLYQQWQFKFKLHPESSDMSGGILVIHNHDSDDIEVSIEQLEEGDLNLAFIWNMYQYLNEHDHPPIIAPQVKNFLERITQQVIAASAKPSVK